MSEQTTKVTIVKHEKLKHNIETQQANIDRINQAQATLCTSTDTCKLNALITGHEQTITQLQAAIQE